MSDSLSASDFLPSFEEARTAGLSLTARVWWRMGLELDLMDREPTDSRQLAAIVVRGRVLRRRRLAYRGQVPAERAQGAPDPVPPRPTDYASSTVTVVGEAAADPYVCSSCRAERGRCRTCAGSGLVVDARCVQIIDEVVELAYPYVPTMSFSLEEKVTAVLEQELAEEHSTPTCLLVDLEPKKSGGPYRQVANREPEFRGFSYDDALQQARTVVAALRGDEPILEELEVHARPILWLRYEAWGVRREVALFYDLSHQLHAMVGDGGL